MQEILRAGGMYPLRNGRFIFSEDAFKRTFAVGDLIHFGPRGTGRITAIGSKRFLFRVTRSGGEFNERVGTIRSDKGWGKP
jgi:hypothetical protein